MLAACVDGGAQDREGTDLAATSDAPTDQAAGTDPAPATASEEGAAATEVPAASPDLDEDLDETEGEVEAFLPDLSRVVVPESCGQPERTVVEGYLDHGSGETWVESWAEPVQWQPPGAPALRVVSMTCAGDDSQRAVGLLFFDADGRRVDEVFLTDVREGAADGRLSVSTIQDGALIVDWFVEAGSQQSGSGVAQLLWRGSSIEVGAAEDRVIELHGEGIGPVTFGEPGDVILEQLIPLLGEPDQITTTENGPRFAWGDLAVQGFSMAPDRPINNWMVSGTDLPEGVVLPHDLGVGATRAEVEAAYPGVELVNGPCGDMYFADNDVTYCVGQDTVTIIQGVQAFIGE